MAFIRRYFREPFPGISHLLGAVLSVVGLVVLIELSKGRPYYVVGFAVYGGSLILLYMASGLCHSLPVDEQGEIKLDRFDRCAIFGLIAGTYTPICLLALHGAWGWTLLGIEWGVAAVGIWGTLWGPTCARWLRTIPYVIMGWLAVVAISPLCNALPGMALWWLFAGGVVYSLGVVVFLTNWPSLWPGKFVAHDLWHVMVLVGSACHFVMVAGYLA
jgi:hemolysin III